eukprot:TRINITY_DN4678_c0_g1_i1.p1 TRINITY_DN4678_c0_g1~~TRINITY_DN4678_c0_g1_i1.p1  ORF type:complete len:312 (+),score=55.30 TRINITY_DN4678_c0_g1_i1:128-1063(+)
MSAWNEYYDGWSSHDYESAEQYGYGTEGVADSYSEEEEEEEEWEEDHADEGRHYDYAADDQHGFANGSHGEEQFAHHSSHDGGRIEEHGELADEFQEDGWEEDDEEEEDWEAEDEDDDDDDNGWYASGDEYWEGEEEEAEQEDEDEWANFGEQDEPSTTSYVHKPPSSILFTQDNVGLQFRRGMSLHQTLHELAAGYSRKRNIRMMRVVLHEGDYYTLDNRRLAVFRLLEQLGRTRIVKAAVVPKPLEEWTQKFTTTTQGAQVHVRRTGYVVGWDAASTTFPLQRKHSRRRKRHNVEPAYNHSGKRRRTQH